MKNLKRDALLLKLGAAKQEPGKAWALVGISLPEPRQAVTPETLWKQYIVLTEVEHVFKEIKQDLGIRPVYHQKDERIELKN